MIALPELPQDAAQHVEDAITALRATLADDVALAASEADIRAVAWAAYSEAFSTLMERGCDSGTAGQAARYAVAEGFDGDARVPQHFQRVTIQ